MTTPPTNSYDSLNLSVRITRGRLLRAAMACVSSDIEEEEHAYSDAHSEYCDDGLVEAARQYLAAVDAAVPAEIAPESPRG